MSYTNIPVANAIDVIKQIANIGGANGWAIEKSETRAFFPTFWHVVMRYQAGGPYFNLVADANNIHASLSRGYVSGVDWDEQPDQSVTVTQPYSQNRNNYARVEIRTLPAVGVHVFAKATPTPYIFVAIEVQPGYYRHFTIGQLDTFGTNTGGAFISTGQPDFGRRSLFSFLKIPLLHSQNNFGAPFAGPIDVHVDATTKIWAFTADDSQVEPDQYQGGHSAFEMQNMILRSPNSFNSRTILQAPFVQVYNYEGGNVPYGTHNAMRYVNMSFYNAGDEITIGSDVWKLFPIIRKGGANATDKNEVQDEGSGDYGIAYLKA